MDHILTIIIKVLVGIILLLLILAIVKIIQILAHLKSNIKHILKLIVLTNDIVEPVKDAIKKPVGQLVINSVGIISSLRKSKNK